MWLVDFAVVHSSPTTRFNLPFFPNSHTHTTVHDKKSQTMPWTNLTTVILNEFPSTVIPPSLGLGTDAITGGTYQLTALDKTSKVRASAGRSDLHNI